MFANPQVPVAALPDADGVDWTPLHPRYALYLQTRALAYALAMAAGLGAALALLTEHVPPERLPDWAAPAAWTLLGAWALKALLMPLAHAPRCGYALRDKDILYKFGVFSRTMTVVPFNRIQHAVRGSGPLERRFGMANLTVFTAGVGGGLQVPGLGEETAERLRVFIIGRLDADDGADAAADEGD